MDLFIRSLIGLSGLAFLLAIASSLFAGRIMEIPAESFSRACTNLALIAVALSVSEKHRSDTA